MLDARSTASRGLNLTTSSPSLLATTMRIENGTNLAIKAPPLSMSSDLLKRLRFSLRALWSKGLALQPGPALGTGALR